MLWSVSGWSGPSLAFRSVERLLVQLEGVGDAGRASLVAAGEVVHALERVGVVGAELGFRERQHSS